MFPLGLETWGWGWGWAAFVAAIIVLGIFLVPWFFFLLSLHNLLNRVGDRNRAMPAAHVWLNFIPIFNLGWFIYTAIKVRDSVKAEYQYRGWMVEGDLAYNLGLATGVLAIASFFLGWVPVLGWGLAIAQLVCWILYWLKTSDLKNTLGDSAAWQRRVGFYGQSGGQRVPPPPPGGAPYAARPDMQGPWTGQSPASQTAVQPAEPWRAEASQPVRLSQSPGAAQHTDASQPGVQTGEEDRPRLCGACGSAYDPGDRFCRTCGLPLP